MEPIVFAPSLTGQTITLGSGPIVINHNLTITGPGANDLTISGTDNTEIFKVDPGATVSISGVTLANGFQNQYSSGQGGAIDNAGTLNLSDVVLSDNGARGPDDGRSHRGFISRASHDCLPAATPSAGPSTIPAR